MIFLIISGYVRFAIFVEDEIYGPEIAQKE
jgi:hypothetical protein